MKKVFLLFYLVFIVKHQGCCQYALAGNPGQFYLDIVPDTFLNGIPGSSEYYSLDLNQDGINDIEFSSNVHSSPGGQIYNVLVSSLNTSVKLASGSIDSTFSPFCGSQWITRRILKRFSYLDPINVSDFVPSSNGYLGFYWASCGAYANSTQWVSTNDKYIGVSITDSISTSYGWIQVNVPYTSSCYVKAHSLYSYNVGVDGTNSPDKTYIYPNPANETLYVQSIQTHFTNKSVLYDIRGKQVDAEILYVNANTYKIDVSQLQTGIYFLLIGSEDGYVRKKIVVQH